MKRATKNIAIMLLAVLMLTLAVSAQKSNQKSQGTKYGEPGFIGEPININVNKADIRDILTYVTEQYGVNFVIDSSVKEVPVTVNITDVPWNTALDAILKANGLDVDINGPILRVADRKTISEEIGLRREADENRLNNKQLYTEFIRLNFARASSGSSDSGYSGGVSSGSTSDGGSNAGSGLLAIIKKRLSKRGSIEAEPLSNTLIITDVRESIDAIRQLVSLLDQPEPQVEVEARIVLASRSFFRQFGFQFNININNPFGRGGGIIGGTLPVTPTTTTTGGGETGGRPVFPIPSGFSDAPTPNTVIGLTTNAFGTAQISALLTAAENKNQVKTIASPRVTALNNRQAEIESGTQIPIVTAQGGGAGAGGQLFTTTFVAVPLRLSVTPQISDSGVVLMKLVVENNTVAANSGGAISTQRMKSEVMVPDGGTTVVGGAVIDDERETRNRTPGLSGIPILGNLFKKKTTQRDTQEILFFITPRIYRPDYQGNQTTGTVMPGGNRTTTILQPVPLGNPASNSDPVTPSPEKPKSLETPLQVIPTAGKPPTK